MSESIPVFDMESSGVQDAPIEALDGPDLIDKAELVSTEAIQPFAFNLRGNSINPIVDVSSSLLAMTIRASELSTYDNLEILHKDIFTEIEAIELELHKLGYDRVIILAHRYCLCSAIDEAIMCSEWGQDSTWSERSLLALFHNETWGGEKFFIVLNRLMQEPDRYIHLIEFMYILMTLGFEGKFRVMHNGRSQLEEILRDTHKVIRNERGDPPEVLLSTKDKIIQKAHYIRRQTPVSLVWLVLLIACAATYGFYYYKINSFTDEVVLKLRTLI